MEEKLLKQAKFLVKNFEEKQMTVVVELWSDENGDFVVLQHFGDPYVDKVYKTDRIDNYGPEDDEKADMHFIYACHKFMNRWL